MLLRASISTDLGEDPTMSLTYRDENRTFATSVCGSERSATLTERGEPERVRTLRVTDGTLQALGVQPMRGRWFTTEETEPRPRDSSPSFSLMRSGNGDSAVTKRCSGASSRWRRRAAIRAAVGGAVAGGRHHAERFQVPRYDPQPDVIVPVRLDPAEEADQQLQFSDACAAEAGRDADRGAAPTSSACCRSGSTRGRDGARKSSRLANHRHRSAVEGRLGRRCREHVMGAYGRDRSSAADRLRQHRESAARAGGHAAPRVRCARRARRRCGANRERVSRRELGFGGSR